MNFKICEGALARILEPCRLTTSLSSTGLDYYTVMQTQFLVELVLIKGVRTVKGLRRNIVKIHLDWPPGIL